MLTCWGELYTQDYTSYGFKEFEGDVVFLFSFILFFIGHISVFFFFFLENL